MHRSPGRSVSRLAAPVPFSERSTVRPTSRPTLRPSTRLVALAVAPVLSLGVLAGCGSSGGSSGSDSSSGSSGSSASSSPSPSSDASSSGSGASGALTTGDFGSRVYAAMQKAGTISFTLTTQLGSQRTTGRGQADLTSSTPSSKVTQQLPGGAGQVDVVLTGGIVYLKTPQFGPKWVKIDPKAKSGLGALLGSLGTNADPGRALKAMDEAAKVTKVGTEQVDGADTTRYRVTVPKEALVKALGADQRMTAALPAQIVYDMWVDGRDLVRKQTSTIAAAGQQVTTTVTYSGFGDPVSIKAPPASQTTTQVPGMSTGS